MIFAGSPDQDSRDLSASLLPLRPLPFALWIRQTIHHLSKATPGDSLSFMTTSAIPEERATAEDERADLFPRRINLQVQRRPGFRQLHHLQLSLNRVLLDLSFLWHPLLLSMK